MVLKSSDVGDGRWRRLALEGLERRMITREWIDWYREEHKSRAREVRLEGGLVKPRHPHWNLPYCSICDLDFEVAEEFYLLYVGGHAVGYHVDCVHLNIDTAKVRNVISQDRGYRVKRGLVVDRGVVVGRDLVVDLGGVVDRGGVDEGMREQFFRYLIDLLSP